MTSCLFKDVNNSDVKGKYVDNYVILVSTIQLETALHSCKPENNEI